MSRNKFLKKTWKEFIYGGHLLSLGASGIIYTTIQLLGLKNSWLLLMVAYLLSQIIYSFDHIVGAKNDIVKRKASQPILIVYLILFLLTTIFLNNWKVSCASFSIIIFGLCYPLLFKKFTKKIPAFKNIFVALIWSLSPVVLVLFKYSLDFNNVFLLLLLFIFLRWFLNTSFFDMKDILADKKDSLKTIPIILGEKKTLTFFHLLNLFSFLPLILAIYYKVLSSFSIGLCVFYLYSFYYLLRSSYAKKNIPFLSYVMADGEYLLWPLAIYIAKIILC